MNWNPKNVRNFFIHAEIDGKKEPIDCGPKNKDGGFKLTIYMRDKGKVTEKVIIAGTTKGKDLQLRINDRTNSVLTLINTER